VLFDFEEICLGGVIISGGCCYAPASATLCMIQKCFRHDEQFGI
jgi:hypothetical protein